ncbi:MAG: hypothetical protein ABIN17_00180 [candidate division WOR-3 bacterium]
MLEKISEMLYKMDETLKLMGKNAEERHKEVEEKFKGMKESLGIIFKSLKKHFLNYSLKKIPKLLIKKIYLP